MQLPHDASSSNASTLACVLTLARLLHLQPSPTISNLNPQHKLASIRNLAGTHVARECRKDCAVREKNDAMTSVATTTDDGKESGGAAKYEFYPIYCNAVSPTLRTWCPLTAHDIFGLQWKVTVESMDAPPVRRRDKPFGRCKLANSKNHNQLQARNTCSSTSTTPYPGPA